MHQDGLAGFDVWVCPAGCQFGRKTLDSHSAPALLSWRRVEGAQGAGDSTE